MGRGGKKCCRRAEFISRGVEAPGREGKRGGDLPFASFLTDQMDLGVAEVSRDLKWAFFAALIALK